MNAIKEILNSNIKKIPLTATGFVYLLFAIVFFCIGFLRGELMTLICGAGLCAYFLIESVMITFSFIAWRKHECAVMLKDNKITIKPVTPKNKFPLCFFGILSFYIFYFIIGEKNKHVKTLKLKLNLTDFESTSILPNAPRGMFSLKDEYIELTDIAGFFSVKFIKKQKSFTSLLFPAEIIDDYGFDIPIGLNQSVNGKAGVLRTDEFYENRPYFRGDDTRKINWKLYAHTNELAVNQGDIMPPPQNTFMVYIQEPVLQKPSPFAVQSFDIFIKRITSIITVLYNKAVNIHFLFYDYDKNSFYSDIVKAYDNDGIVKIKELTARPQIQLFKHHIKKITERETKFNSFIITEIKKKHSLLFFTMPYRNIDMKYINPAFQNTMFFYFGPIVKLTSPANFIHRFLFYTSRQKNRKKRHRALNKAIASEVKRISCRGFHGYQI